MRKAKLCVKSSPQSKSNDAQISIGHPNRNIIECAGGKLGRTLFCLCQTHTNANKQTQWDRAAHLIRGVLGVGLALSRSAGHGSSSDITEIDLTLGGWATSRLAPNNDGTARQDL